MLLNTELFGSKIRKICQSVIFQVMAYLLSKFLKNIIKMAVSHKIKFYPVDNGDNVLIKLLLSLIVKSEIAKKTLME